MIDMTYAPEAEADYIYLSRAEVAATGEAGSEAAFFAVACVETADTIRVISAVFDRGARRRR
jgi:hypothetical protein